MRYKFLLAFTLCLFLSTGTAHAGFEEGQAAYNKKDWNNAVRFLLPLARNNHDGALVLFGKMYADGKGVPVDLEKAFELFNRAAKLGNPEAMVAVAALYSAGKGTDKNMKAAFEWFRKAAELNYSLAQFSLGIALAAGDPDNGLQADLVESYKWLMLSSRDTFLPPKFKNTAEKLARHSRSKEMSSEQKIRGDHALRNWKPKTWEEVSATSVYWHENDTPENDPESADETVQDNPADNTEDHTEDSATPETPAE